MNTHRWSRPLGALSFVVACAAAAGCGRDTNARVDKLKSDVHAVKDDVHAVKEDVKRDVNGVAKDAKQGADRIAEQLPSADHIRDGLSHAGDKLNASAQRLKSELRGVRDDVREKLEK